jgi:hypothetical protein
VVYTLRNEKQDNFSLHEIVYLLVNFPTVNGEQIEECNFKIHLVLTGVHIFTFITSYYPGYMTIGITVQYFTLPVVIRDIQEIQLILGPAS